MHQRLKTLLFGPAPGSPPPPAAPPPAWPAFGPRAGHAVELLSVTPHGADLHLVVATVDGEPFRNFVPSGDIRGEEPAVQRRILARRVRALHKPAPPAPVLTGREQGLP